MLKNLKSVSFKSRKQQRKEKNQHLTVGLLIGTAIGAVAGIFSQTEKGKTATKKVVDTAKDLTEKSKGVVCESINKVKKAKHSHKHKELGADENNDSSETTA
jgi:gas vesicle protein